MDSPNRHLDYHRERHADLVREARRRELASAVAAANAADRRSFLRRAWERRFRTPSAAEPATPALEGPPATNRQ